MAYEQKDMSWSLFKNDRKESENHPDYTGSGKVGGREVWVSAWVKETKDGRKYFSGSYRFKENQPETDPQAPLERVDLTKELNDDLPF